MTIEQMIAFNIALIVAMISPGPAFLISTKVSLTQGKMSGIVFGFGLALMASCWTLMALLGLDTIFKVFPWAYSFMKIGGALYLIYLAWMSWRHSKQPLEDQAFTARSNVFFHGILLNLLNPKSVLFASAVLVIIFPPNLSLSETMIITLNQFVMEISFYSTIAIIMGRSAIKSAYLKAKMYIERVTSVILGSLGLKLLLER